MQDNNFFLGNNKQPEAEKPLKQTIESLDALAKESSPAMDAKTKSRQRDMLLVEAKKLHQSTSVAVPEIQAMPMSATSESSGRYRAESVAKPAGRPFLAWLSGAAVVGLVAVFAIMIIPNLNQGSFQAAKTAITDRLTIPEALAADAFSITAQKSDRAGLDVDTSFVINSKVDVSEKDLAQTLQIVPAVDFQLRKTGDKTFTLTPSNNLDTGKIYKLAVATEVQKVDGSVQPRDFAFAFQTKNDFRVFTTSPADGSNSVPLNGTVEFQLSQPGFVDATSSFAIAPAVQGNVSIVGQSVVFTPSEPLAAGTRYQATLKKGLAIQGSDLKLETDSVINFETETTSTNPNNPATYQVSIPEFIEMRPGQEPVISLNSGLPKSMASTTFEVAGFSLSLPEAKELLNARLSLPDWTSSSRGKYTEYAKFDGRPSAFTIKTGIESQDAQTYVGSDWIYNVYLRLPKTEPGLYAVRVQPTNGKTVWFVMQVTNTMTYSMADKDTLLVWAVDADTRRQIANLPIVSSAASVSTNQDGIARLPAPTFLSATNTDVNAKVPVEVLEVGSGKTATLVAVRAAGMRPFEWYGMVPTVNQTWSYLYTDRPLYRPTDSMSFFAFAQDRASKDPIENLKVEIRRSDSYVFSSLIWNPTQKSYQTQDIKTDAMGSAQGTFSWTNYGPGYYTLAVVREGVTIAERSFEIRDFIKPTYQLTLTPDQKSIFQGDAITGKLKASFYSGAPVARTTFTLEDVGGYSMSGAFQKVELTTDENGEANFRLSTSSTQSCDTANPTNRWQTCGEPYFLDIRATPNRAEEANITGQALVQVYPSALDLIVQPRTEGKNVSLTVKTRRVTLEQDKEFDAWANRALTVKYTPMWWERIQTGTSFDPFTKLSVPTYRYEERSGETKTAELQTDANGRAVFNFAMDDNRTYAVTVYGQDDARHTTLYRTTIAKGWYDHVNYDENTSAAVMNDFYAQDQEPSLAFVPKNQTGEFSIGENVQVQYRLGEQPIDVEKQSPVLFVRAQNGLKEAELGSGANLSFRFSENQTPNLEIRGITLVNGRFQMRRITAQSRMKDQLLKLDVSTVKPSIAPGEQASVTVKAVAQQTQAAVRAKLVCASVDDALLSLSGSQKEDPYYALYKYVPDGILYEAASHEESLANMFGGAEMGAGGGERADMKNVRKNFKDTADFRVIDTDAQGNAQFNFPTPDNLTSWRIECVGLTSDLKIGAGSISFQVSKPVFVDAVLPPRVLTSDKPVLKLRAFGSGLPTGTPVTFRIESTTLGINQTVEGKAGESSYLSIEKLPLGTHKLTVSVSSANGQDAVERSLTIVDSNYTKQELTRLEAAPGLTLPADQSAETRVTVTNNGRASLLNLLYGLRYGFEGRADSLLAMQRANEILSADLGVEKDELSSENLFAFQVDGGIKLLPYSSADLELSSQVAATDVSKLDASRLKVYLAGFLANTNREQQIQAMSGLAAMQEPMLAQLQEAMRLPDLNVKEQLAILRGLTAAGDQENARKLLETILATSDEKDGMIEVQLGKTEAERYANTAEIAAAAAELDHAKAAALGRFVESHWSNESFPILAKLRYVVAMRNRLPLRDITMRYSVNGQTEQTLTLKRDVPSESLTLTREEAASFRITFIDGPATLVLTREIQGRPTPNTAIKITRTYTAPRALTELLDGDTVTVQLNVDFDKSLNRGCYTVTDYLPGNLEPIVDWQGQWWDKPFYPVGNEPGRMSFVACKNPDLSTGDSTTFKYDARIVSRGSFTAEAPMMQDLDQPSKASLGTDQVFKTK